MAISQHFAYNPSGQQISGTTQSGVFAIGTPFTGFTGSPQFWNGPDEELGYIIAQPVPAGNQPNPVGIPAYLGFYRSSLLNESSFIELAETISGQQFTDGNQATSWLNTNGYWTSYVSTP